MCKNNYGLVQCCPTKNHTIRGFCSFKPIFSSLCGYGHLFLLYFPFSLSLWSTYLTTMYCQCRSLSFHPPSPSLCLILQTSKRSEEEVAGRTDGNVKVIFPGSMTEPLTQSSTTFRPGDYVIVKVRVYGYILVAQVQR